MWFVNLFTQPGVAHSVLLVSLVIAAGLALSRIKFGSVSLGVTWVLFVGIVVSHFGLVLDPTTSHFIKEFGLILFIYSIGMEVGPGFFSSFRKGGLSLNLLATCIILLGSLTAYGIHLATGEDLNAMIGVLYGAVTNTPGLGAAQQTYSDMHDGAANPIFAQGYAVAYPLGVVGIILSIVLLRYIFRIKSFDDEVDLHNRNVSKHNEDVEAVSIEVTNPAIVGHTIREMLRVSGRKVVITRMKHADSDNIEMASASTQLQMGDRIFLVAKPDDVEAITMLLGRRLEGVDYKQWSDKAHSDLVSSRIVVTNSNLQGRKIKDLGFRESLHVTISRVKRAGIDLVVQPDLFLQLGDRLTVVGTAEDVKRVEQAVGNAVKRLDAPQLFATFIGIALGVLLGSMPIFLPGMPVPIKLGLAGGPLIVSILLSRFGPQLHIVTYTTASVKLLLREMGICLFMASVGLGAGQGFVETVVNGGLWWVLYGFIITFFPCLLVGMAARFFFHRSYFSIAGLISGSMTDPPALAYSNSICSNDQASVAYATVYPLSMFLRVLVAQVLVLLAM